MTPRAPRRSAPKRVADAPIEPHFRRLRAFLSVIEHGGIHRASRHLHVTQSSLTKFVKKLESDAGVALFERVRKGMVPTEYGFLLAQRAKRALAQLESAEHEIRAINAANGGATNQSFAGKVTHRQLTALIGTSDHQSETVAAKHLALSQPAITVGLRNLERLIGNALFTRTARGMTPTVYGEVIARRAKLAFAEIQAASDDISAREGVIKGRVSVGALPLSGAVLAPRAIRLLLDEHPEIHVSVIDGTYRALLQGLRCGDIDVIVGALSFPMVSDIDYEVLFHDRLSLVARIGHPLTRRARLTPGDLASVEWVVPRSGTPARSSLSGYLASHGLRLGGSPIETNAWPTIRALLMESDRVGVITRHQIYFEERTGMLAVLPLELKNTEMPIGMRTRADAGLSIGVKSLLNHLRAIAAHMGAQAP